MKEQQAPHFLFYGPSGTGKTSTALALAKEMYGSQNMAQMVLQLNASDERTLKVVQTEIKTFASAQEIFRLAPSERASARPYKFKLVILDEADSMDASAQMALRRIMEDYSQNTRFCIIVNQIHRLSPALISRCARFRFRPLPPSSVLKQLKRVVKQEQVNIQPEALTTLAELCGGDMRQALNILQECHIAFKSDIIHGYSASSSQSHWKIITSDVIYDFAGVPKAADINDIISTLLSTDGYCQCIEQFQTLIELKGLELSKIITLLAVRLTKMDVPAKVKVSWLAGLADIEAILADGGSETVEIGTIVGIVKSGWSLIKGEKPNPLIRGLSRAFDSSKEGSDDGCRRP